MAGRGRSAFDRRERSVVLPQDHFSDEEEDEERCEHIQYAYEVLLLLHEGRDGEERQGRQTEKEKGREARGGASQLHA